MLSAVCGFGVSGFISQPVFESELTRGGILKIEVKEIDRVCMCIRIAIHYRHTYTLPLSRI